MTQECLRRILYQGSATLRLDHLGSQTRHFLSSNRGVCLVTIGIVIFTSIFLPVLLLTVLLRFLLGSFQSLFLLLQPLPFFRLLASDTFISASPR